MGNLIFQTFLFKKLQQGLLESPKFGKMIKISFLSQMFFSRINHTNSTILEREQFFLVQLECVETSCNEPSMDINNDFWKLISTKNSEIEQKLLKGDPYRSISDKNFFLDMTYIGVI